MAFAGQNLAPVVFRGYDFALGFALGFAKRATLELALSYEPGDVSGINYLIESILPVDQS